MKPLRLVSIAALLLILVVSAWAATAVLVYGQLSDGKAVYVSEATRCVWSGDKTVKVSTGTGAQVTFDKSDASKIVASCDKGHYMNSATGKSDTGKVTATIMKDGSGMVFVTFKDDEFASGLLQGTSKID